MVDYKILDGIPGYAKDEDVRHIAASIGLFFVRNDGNIVPIAIQLNQIPGEGNPIYTPNDNQYDWIAAKLWLRNADTQCHQVRFELFNSSQRVISFVFIFQSLKRDITYFSINSSSSFNSAAPRRQSAHRQLLLSNC